MYTSKRIDKDVVVIRYVYLNCTRIYKKYIIDFS